MQPTLADFFDSASGPKVMEPAPTFIYFLALPPEIRDNIYEFIVTEPNTILSTCQKGATTPRFHSSSYKDRNVHDLNIFRVSKQVFHEARRIFFSRNVFDINLIEESSKLRYNFVPTEFDYAIKALRHIKVSVHLHNINASSVDHLAAEKLRYILERATDLRTLEVWITQDAGHKAGRRYREEKDPVYAALGLARNLHRLKIVVDRNRYTPSDHPMPRILAGLRKQMLENGERVANNPVWVGFDGLQSGFSVAMCHDTRSGECLLSRDERRYFGAEVHELTGEEMDKRQKLNM